MLTAKPASRPLFAEIRNKRGTSVIEIVPILAIFILLINFGVGFFGVIHSGILQSIAARNYAFETFRNRANLNYLRDLGEPLPNLYYNKSGFRYHAILSESNTDNQNFIPSKRPIKLSSLNTGLDPVGSATEHNQAIAKLEDNKKTSDVFTGKTRGEGNSGVDPVWIKTMYGICMTSTCGPRL